MERYTMPQHQKPGRTLPFVYGTQPQLYHLQRVIAKDYDCLRAPHAHADTVEIVLMIQGEGAFSVDGAQIPVQKGQFIVYNSGIVHEERLTDHSDIRCFSCSILGLHLQGMRPGALIPDDMFPRFELGERFHEMSELIEAMFQECAAPLPHASRSIQYLLLAVLSIVLDLTELPQHALPVRNRDSLLCQSVKQYIDQHFKEELTLQQIADAVNFSVSHMCHVFKEKIGYSPLQYIVLRRIGEAQTLLETTALPVVRIGMEVGFPDPSYFNAVFRKKVGMSPLRYRGIYHRREEGDGMQ
ncbi:MAG: AraC family transcriptional regulator [Eubacteriales bacterium]|nr:AraC family transcriptional regulator [Eubacteriales bacterium]